jgi:hypothetical protein
MLLTEIDRESWQRSVKPSGLRMRMARVAVTEFLDNWLGLSVAVSQSTCVLMQLLHSEPVVSR